MHALMALTRANIKSYMRDRAAVFWTLAFPLVFIVLFGLIFQGGSSDLTLAWVDDDGSPESAQLRADFAAQPGVAPVDLSQDAMEKLIVLLEDISYDICVLTGDYRGQTFGPFDAALAGMARVRAALKGTVYGVLGNHDSIRMVPGLEEMGIRETDLHLLAEHLKGVHESGSTVAAPA